MPLSGDNNGPLNGNEMQDFFEEAYHAKNNSPIGKKKIFVNLDPQNERMRADLNMNWTPARMEQGAYSLMNSNIVTDETLAYNGGDKVPQIGQPKYIPDAYPGGNLYGTVKISVQDKGYDLYFRETKDSDLAAFDIGGGMDVDSGIGVDAKLGRAEEFIFWVPGEGASYLQWDGVYDETNIRYIFKNIAHFQFILGGISYMQFYESEYYKHFSEEEKILFSNTMPDEGGVGQMQGQIPNKIYGDYFIELETPYTPKEVKMMNSTANIIQGDIHTKFLFHSPKYNEIASEQGLFLLHETHLPCFYSYLSEYTAMQDSMALGAKAPKNKDGQADSSDYTLGGHYDQLTLGGLIPYDSVPFFITKPGHQKLSMVDLVTMQQSQTTLFSRGPMKDSILENSEYSDSSKQGAPYFENFAIAFRKMSTGGEGEFEGQIATQGLYSDPDSLSDNYLEAKAFYIQQYNRSIIFTRKNMKYARDFNEKINVFPMHVKLEIPNSSNSVFASCLEELDMESEFLDMIVSTAEQDMLDVEIVEEAITSLTYNEGVHNIVPPTFEEFKYDESFELKDQQVYRAYNIETFLDKIDSGIPPVAGGIEERNFVGPGGYQSYSKKLKDKDANTLTFQSILKTTLFKSKLANLQKKNFRSYKDLLLGKTAYKEIVGYRVAKHVVTGDGVVSPNPIQNIFFMNKEDIDKIIYYDTQIKYNRKYKYIVHAYVFVVGNRYTFPDAINWNTPTVVTDKHEAETEASDKFVRLIPDDPTLNQDVLDTLGVKAEDLYLHDADYKGDQIQQGQVQVTDTMYAAKAFYKTLKVYNMVSPVIVEVPYFDFSGEYEHQLVLDDPPLYPQVTFTPYREINNKLLITLETTLGNYSAKPVAVLPTDEDYFALARMAQNKNDMEPLEYNAEDSNTSYQIFRIGPNPDGNTPPPHKYSDFENHLYLTTTTETSLQALDDTLQRNRTYYYMFRAIDRRGGISNPSPVYKVQLVGDPDYNLSYPKVSVYNFQENKPKKQKKSFRRYLHINPALEQITVDGESSGFDAMDSADTYDAPVIGVAKESMVGNKYATGIEKKFKIRLTSKATGRKIDFNVKFVHRHVKNV